MRFRFGNGAKTSELVTLDEIVGDSRAIADVTAVILAHCFVSPESVVAVRPRVNNLYCYVHVYYVIVVNLRT